MKLFAVRKILSSYVSLFMVVTLVNGPAIAQQPATQPPDGGQSSQKRMGPKRQAAIIIFAGLGGAVLGLSTLSFYGRPQDKLSNIAIGAAVGIIIGTAYVTFRAATQPSEFYGEGYKGSINNPFQTPTGPVDSIAGYRFEF